MNDLLIGTFVTSSLTLICTAGMIFYTRKNLKTTKYIDVITAQKISRIESIREAVAVISTDIHITLKRMVDEIEEKRVERIDPNSDFNEINRRHQEPYSVLPTVAFECDGKVLILSDLILKFNRLKLRLDFNSDIEIIRVIDYFIDFYSSNEMKDNSNIEAAKEKLNLFMRLFQNLSETEWKRVKRESYGKIKI